MDIKLEVLGGIVPNKRTYTLRPRKDLEKRIKSFEANNGFGEQTFNPFLVDNESYILTIKTEREKKEYKIVEGLVTPDVLNLLDDIMEAGK